MSVASPFTSRQKDVIHQILQGHTSRKELAKALGCCSGTVQAHLRDIYAKLDLSGPGAAVKLAIWAQSHQEAL
jgi:DNA-binding NarL/FixJ family response regulator